MRPVQNIDKLNLKSVRRISVTFVSELVSFYFKHLLLVQFLELNSQHPGMLFQLKVSSLLIHLIA